MAIIDPVTHRPYVLIFAFKPIAKVRRSEPELHLLGFRNLIHTCFYSICTFIRLYCAGRGDCDQLWADVLAHSCSLAAEASGGILPQGTPTDVGVMV